MLLSLLKVIATDCFSVVSVLNSSGDEVLVLMCNSPYISFGILSVKELSFFAAVVSLNVTEEIFSPLIVRKVSFVAEYRGTDSWPFTVRVFSEVFQAPSFVALPKYKP